MTVGLNDVRELSATIFGEVRKTLQELEASNSPEVEAEDILSSFRNNVAELLKVVQETKETIATFDFNKEVVEDLIMANNACIAVNSLLEQVASDEIGSDSLNEILDTMGDLFSANAKTIDILINVNGLLDINLKTEVLQSSEELRLTVHNVKRFAQDMASDLQDVDNFVESVEDLLDLVDSKVLEVSKVYDLEVNYVLKSNRIAEAGDVYPSLVSAMNTVLSIKNFLEVLDSEEAHEDAIDDAVHNIKHITTSCTIFDVEKKIKEALDILKG